MGYTYSSILNINTVEVSVWICNFIPSFDSDIITYPCPDVNAVKESPKVMEPDVWQVKSYGACVGGSIEH